jgi:peptidoglycan hydrolase-like protein with peptidoglycan-binding domain
MTLPSTLRGVENGKLPADLLVKIGVGSARMEKTAARAFMAMFAEARRAGFDIRHVGDYRPFDQQLNLFLSRYEPTSLSNYSVTPSSRRKKWVDAKKYGYNSVYWVKKKINGSYPATAATPGNSNHGWGLALDIAEEYDNDSAPDPIRTSFVNWLCDNAFRYGISAELQSEVWHWRYVSGDRIPEAVLVYEKGGKPSISAPVGPALTCDFPGSPLALGSKGVAVKLVQSVIGAKTDGDFGPATERRVRAWQARNGFEDTGVVDKKTWKAMFG